MNRIGAHSVCLVVLVLQSLKKIDNVDIYSFDLADFFDTSTLLLKASQRSLSGY